MALRHCTPLHIAALQSSVEAAEVIVRDSPKVVERTVDHFPLKSGFVDKKPSLHKCKGYIPNITHFYKL